MYNGAKTPCMEIKWNVELSFKQTTYYLRFDILQNFVMISVFFSYLHKMQTYKQNKLCFTNKIVMLQVKIACSKKIIHNKSM